MNKLHLNEKQLVQYHLRVLDDAERLGALPASRLYGIHRSTIYEWRKSHIPKKRGPINRVSWQTDHENEQAIIKLKTATNFGPKRIKNELALIGLNLGEKAIRGVLERNDLVKHHRKKRVKKQQKFYAPYPGYRVQIDTKTVPDEGFDLRTSQARYQFTAIDICSKIRFCLIYEDLSNQNSINFLKKVLAFYSGIGINVECVQTDNHSTFTNLYSGGNKKKDHELLRVHPFTKYCLKNGIEHKLSRPGTPQHNAFVERSHRTDGEEFYRLIDLPNLDLQALQLEMKKWMFKYNFLRLHSSCGNQPPMKYFHVTVWDTGA